MTTVKQFQKLINTLKRDYVRTGGKDRMYALGRFNLPSNIIDASDAEIFVANHKCGLDDPDLIMGLVFKKQEFEQADVRNLLNGDIDGLDTKVQMDFLANEFDSAQNIPLEYVNKIIIEKMAQLEFKPWDVLNTLVASEELKTKIVQEAIGLYDKLRKGEDLASIVQYLGMAADDVKIMQRPGFPSCQTVFLYLLDKELKNGKINDVVSDPTESITNGTMTKLFSVALAYVKHNGEPKIVTQADKQLSQCANSIADAFGLNNYHVDLYDQRDQMIVSAVGAFTGREPVLSEDVAASELEVLRKKFKDLSVDYRFKSINNTTDAASIMPDLKRGFDMLGELALPQEYDYPMNAWNDLTTRVYMKNVPEEALPKSGTISKIKICTYMKDKDHMCTTNIAKWDKRADDTSMLYLVTSLNNPKLLPQQVALLNMYDIKLR